MPSPEVRLWSQLRGKQVHGYKFRRQYGVGPYVIDFYCPALKLAIELDGASHFEVGAPARDQARQRYIESFGIRFLRFTNVEVCRNLDGVLTAIEQAVSDMEMENLPPSPLTKGG
jgi:very-short-patch-repair endonuclease